MEVTRGYKQSEVGLVPRDWDVRSLASVAHKISVGIASAATHAYRSAGIPLLRNQNIKAGHLDDSDVLYIDREYEEVFRNKRLRASDLLTARTGNPGTTCVVPGTYDSAQSFTTLITRPRTDQVEPDFLCAFINSGYGQRFFEQSQIGGAQKNVNAGALRNMPVPVPPLPEQRAIAGALSAVDVLVAGLDRLIAKKRDLKQAAMQHLLTGQTRLPGFHGEWNPLRFEDLAFLRKERIDPRSSGEEQLCIELEHVAPETGALLGSTSASQSASAKAVFRPGDVLFGKLRAYLRKYWLATCPGVCSTEFWVLAPRSDIVSSQFLFQIIRTDRFIAAASSAYGTHMPRSDWNAVKNHAVRVPSLREQAAIAEVLADMDAEPAALEARREKTRALKQAMMHELLTGRTRLV
jgi:type I restriction enzyme S subunit